MRASDLSPAMALLLSFFLSTAQAVNFAPNVSPTPSGTPVLSGSPSVITGAPTMGRMRLDLRGILTDIQQADTCGFVDGNWNDKFTCYGVSCTFTNSHVGCCDARGTCGGVWTTCHPSMTTPFPTSANPSDLYCGYASPYCGTYVYPGSTTDYLCNAVASPATYFMALNATTRALAGYTSSYNQGPGPTKSTKDWVRFVGIGVAALVVLIILLVASICWRKRKARRMAAMAAPPGGVYYAGGPGPAQGGIPLGNQGPAQYQPVYGQGLGGQQGPYQPYGGQEYGQVPYGQQTVYPNK